MVKVNRNYTIDEELLDKLNGVNASSLINDLLTKHFLMEDEPDPDKLIESATQKEKMILDLQNEAEYLKQRAKEIMERRNQAERESLIKKREEERRKEEAEEKKKLMDEIRERKDRGELDLTEYWDAICEIDPRYERVRTDKR